MNRFLSSMITALALGLPASPACAQSGDKPGEAQPPPPPDLVIPPAPPLPPGEALKTFQLQPGFRIELVAAEPLVEAPIAMQFDPDGRLYVIEMRGFMRSAEGLGEDQPLGRVSVLEDADSDGRMDLRTTFLDGLIMPRALALVRDGVLVAEPPRLWFCRDTNGDGKADEKIEVANDYAAQNDPKLGKNSNPEHASNGLMLAMDNWMYSPYHGFRYRNDRGRWLREPTFANRGQWGMTQDDFGRLFYNSNSDQLRGDLVPAEYTRRNTNHTAAGASFQVAKDQSVWPIRVTPGVNRGYQKNVLRDGKLASFTAACGPVIYRGDQFPQEFRGNAFVAEPSGNLIRRNVLSEKDGVVTATNAYVQAEFLTSTDERFRPVNLYNGPDGALYIVDMYRGVLQHRIYMTTFLRRQVQERGLEQPLDQGRIYRVVYEGTKRPASKPRLAKASTSDLVKNLSHPNGWWRDTAQRLLVERADEAAAPRLRKLAASASEPASRLHALWTLSGLGKLDFAAVQAALRDSHPKVRAAGIRLSEKLASPPQAQSALHKLINDPSLEVRWQLALTLGEFRDDDALARIASENVDQSFIRDAVISGVGGRELEFLERLFANSIWAAKDDGKNAFLQALAKCVFLEKNPARVARLLELAVGQSAELAWRQAALLDGVLATVPPAPKDRPAPPPKQVALDAEPAALSALQKDAVAEVRERAGKVLALLTWPGKPSSETGPGVQPLTAEQQKRFEAGRELYLVTCGACHQPHGQGQEGLAPPLLDSEWTTGSPGRLIRISLNGVRGGITVKGRTYELEMPALGVLDDEQLAAVLTYVRREWGHTASAIDPDMVKQVRAATEKRDEPWTELELLRVP